MLVPRAKIPLTRSLKAPTAATGSDVLQARWLPTRRPAEQATFVRLTANAEAYKSISMQSDPATTLFVLLA